MKNIGVLILFLFSTTAVASEWKHLSGYDLYGLLHSELAEQTGTIRKSTIVGTSGLSWPDGRQATVTLVNIEQNGKTWLYRCFQYLSSDMKPTGEACYELRK